MQRHHCWSRHRRRDCPYRRSRRNQTKPSTEWNTLLQTPRAFAALAINRHRRSFEGWAGNDGERTGFRTYGTTIRPAVEQAEFGDGCPAPMRVFVDSARNVDEWHEDVARPIGTKSTRPPARLNSNEPTTRKPVHGHGTVAVAGRVKKVAAFWLRECLLVECRAARDCPQRQHCARRSNRRL